MAQWNRTSVSDTGFVSSGVQTNGVFRMNITNGLGALGVGNYQLETNYTRGYYASPSGNFSVAVDYKITNQPPSPVGTGHYIDYSSSLCLIALTGSPPGLPFAGTVCVGRFARIGDTSGLVGPTPRYTYAHNAYDSYSADIQTTNTTGSLRIDHYATNGSFFGYFLSGSSTWILIGNSTPTFNGVVTGFSLRLTQAAHPANTETLGAGWVTDFDNFLFATPAASPVEAPLTFRVTPSTAGVIVLNGQQYSDGDTRKITTLHKLVGILLKRGIVSNQSFYDWITSGRVKVENPFLNQTVLEILGPGTLTAEFHALTNSEIFPSSLILATLVAGLILILRSRGRSLYHQISR